MLLETGAASKEASSALRFLVFVFNLLAAELPSSFVLLDFVSWCSQGSCEKRRAAGENRGFLGVLVLFSRSWIVLFLFDGRSLVLVYSVVKKGMQGTGFLVLAFQSGSAAS